MTPKADTIADQVGKLAADALRGSLTMTMGDGLRLVKTFAAYNRDPALRLLAVRQFADLLAREAPDVASRLVDALAERVGR